MDYPKQVSTDLGLIIEINLKFHSYANSKISNISYVTTNLLSCTLNRDSKFILNIYLTHVRPLIDYASSLWNVGYIGDLRRIERLQRRWTRVIDDMSNLSYGQRLRRLDLLKGRLLRADLILVWKIIYGECAIPAEELFTFSPAQHTRGHSLKLYLPRTILETRQRFFAIRVVNEWNALSPDTVLATSLPTFKNLLKRDLGDKLYDYYD